MNYYDRENYDENYDIWAENAEPSYQREYYVDGLAPARGIMRGAVIGITILIALSAWIWQRFF